MSTQGPREAPQTAALTPLPRLEDIPRRGEGYDADRVSEAFDAFRRHASQLQAQLRVLQAAQRTADVEPTGHAVRMDALHLIRAAADFADTLERDAQAASAAQLARTEEEVRRRQRELQRRDGEIERYRDDSERQRAEIINAAKNEARELVANANAQAAQEIREAEARAARLLEQARHQATELTNATRAEVEQTLEWARAQASTVMGRAQQGAERLLAAAGLGEDALAEVVQGIMKASEDAVGGGRAPTTTATVSEAPAPGAEPTPQMPPPVVAEPSPEAPETPAEESESGDDGSER
jgi:hypothetical protein